MSPGHAERYGTTRESPFSRWMTRMESRSAAMESGFSAAEPEAIVESGEAASAGAARNKERMAGPQRKRAARMVSPRAARTAGLSQRGGARRARRTNRRAYRS